jgi:hypothetical protein
VRPLTAALLAAASLAAPAAAASRLFVAGEGEATLQLRVDGAGLGVGSGDATQARLALPPGSDVDAFATTRRGWLAAGSVLVPGGRELALWVGGDGKSAPATMPAPPERAAAVRASPVPLLRDGELVGLAWLEGEAADRFAVRASAWDGREWSSTATVAPPGTGSQLALTGAVLADGSWLLAWSAYDGEDDEVVWSVRRGGRGRARWSAPRPVDAGNQVPDTTPAVRADGDGALLAWSRYDGNDYRLVLARFAGGRWEGGDWAAAAGTILPRWEGQALTYRDAAREAWVAARLDAADRLHVEADAAGPAEPRPVVERRAGALRLRFP